MAPAPSSSCVALADDIHMYIAVVSSQARCNKLEYKSLKREEKHWKRAMAHPSIIVRQQFQDISIPTPIHHRKSPGYSSERGGLLDLSSSLTHLLAGVPINNTSIGGPSSPEERHFTRTRIFVVSILLLLLLADIDTCRS